MNNKYTTSLLLITAVAIWGIIGSPAKFRGKLSEDCA